MSYISLPFDFVRKKKKSVLIYQKPIEQVSILRDCFILEIKFQIVKIQLLIL